jgi:hypothetical protein
MANVDITPGIGKTIRTDTVSGAEYQIIKLDFGAVGASSLATGTNPFPITTLDSGGTSMTNVTYHALQAMLMTAIQQTNLVPSTGLTLQHAGGQITSGTTTTLVTLTAAQVITIFGLFLFNGGTANNLTLQDSTPTNLIGTSAVINFAANQGVMFDLRADKWFNACASGTSLQLITSSGGPLTWDLYYTKG